MKVRKNVMKEINMNTKRGQELLALARRNEGFALSDVYANAGYRKKLAYDYCFREALEEGTPLTFHICSHNAFSFTCAWDSKDGVRYSTAQNDYLIKGATL